MSLLAKSAEAPRTPHKNGGRDAVDALIRKLRDDMDLGLDIAPRDHTYSPAQHNRTLSDTIYNNIKFLYWKDLDALHAAISECKSDFTGSLKHLSVSARRRTEHVSHKVGDTVWFVKNRIHQPSHRRPSTPSPTRTSPRSRPGLRSLQRSDSKTDLTQPSTPTSPLARKSMADTQSTTPRNTRSSSRRGGDSFLSYGTTAATSFTSDITRNDNDQDSYGSSWRESQDPRTDAHHDETDLGHSRINEQATGKPKEQSRSKRKRTDETKITPETPSKTSRTLPQNQDSFSPTRPAKSQWQLKNLVKDGLGNETVADPVRFWNDISADARFATSTCSLSGVLTLNETSKGPLVKTELNPVKWGSPSSRAQRHFGSHRFLVLAAPSFTKNLPNKIAGEAQEEHRLAAFTEWLSTPKTFLGRTWHIFYVEDIEKAKGRKSAKAKATKYGRELVRYITLFATKGLAISKEISIFEFLNWMLPFQENAHQLICKAYARFLLSIKQSTPSINFKPSQIRRIDDLHANGEPEDTRFDDPAFDDKPQKGWDPREVMTDGCARISVGALKTISGLLGIDEEISLVQGRINGAKGTWTASDSWGTKEVSHQDIWIEIRESQLKVEPREEDLNNERCDEDRWCFDVKGYSRPPRISHLHKDFLQVLEDRGVPSQTLLDIVKEGVDPPIEELREMIDNPGKLAYWLQRCSQREHETHDGPGLPRESSRRASLLVDKTGYMPRDNVIAAEAIERMIETYLQRIRSQLRFTCPKSTLLYGQADHKGALKPGEIHLILSRPLEGEGAKEKFMDFENKDVLVARDPTMRGSDIQRVRCIRHPDLQHIKDVVVFPSTGRIPLAAKLQGGDYDGDRFWVCADPRLVMLFKNAPVLEQRGIDFFGVEREERTLGEIVNPEDFGTDKHAEAFLRIVLPMACQDKALGLVTNYCNDLSYARHRGKGLWDDDVTMVADLHDHIIDADKNGYIYDKKDFIRFCHEHGLPKNLKQREYDVNIGAVKLRKDADYDNENELLRILKKSPKHKPSHILDRMLFEVVNPPFHAYLQALKSDVVEPAGGLKCDRDLEYYLTQLESYADRGLPFDLRAEIQAVERQLQEVVNTWTRAWLFKNEAREKLLLQCAEQYNNIRPTKPDHPWWWAISVASSAPKPWDCFKLAVFARKHYAKKKRAIFWIACDTVCKVKALSESGKRNLDKMQESKKAIRPKESKRTNAANALPAASSEDPDFEDGFDEDLFEFCEVLE